MKRVQLGTTRDGERCVPAWKFLPETDTHSSQNEDEKPEDEEASSVTVSLESRSGRSYVC